MILCVFSSPFHLSDLSLASTHTAPVKVGHPGDGPFPQRQEDSVGAEDATALRPENLSAPYLRRLQVDVTSQRINSASFGLFAIPRRRFTSSLFSFYSPPPPFFFTATRHSPNGYVHLRFITSAGHRRRLLSAGYR